MHSSLLMNLFSCCHLHNQDSVVSVSSVGSHTECITDASSWRQLCVVHRTPPRQVQRASSILGQKDSLERSPCPAKIGVPLKNNVRILNLRPNYLGLLHEPSNVRYFSVIVGHEGAGTQGHLEYSCIISWNWKRLMSHLSLMAALVSLLKSFLKPIPASKSVKLFWALIRLVASRRTWDFWSNLDRSTITDKCRPLMKPTSQCHSLACWTSDEPHLVPCHQQSLCPLSHPQLEPDWQTALSSERGEEYRWWMLFGGNTSLIPWIERQSLS